MTYPNGEVPLNKLVREGEHYFFPGTHARWKELQRRVHADTGVWLYITPGPNAYRGLAEQKRMRQELGVNAAVPGRSSHGGLWTGQTKGHSGLPTWVTNRESGAIDIGNWFEVPWDVLTKHARAVGFIPDIVVPTEKWHFVDLNPWQVPTFGAAADVQEDDMFEDKDRALLEQIRGELRELLPGKAGVRYQGETNKVLTETLQNTRKLSSQVEEMWHRWLPGKANVKTQGDLNKLFVEVLTNTRANAAALKALAESQGLDPEQVQQTIDSAVRDSLKDIEITLKAGGAEA